MLIEISIAWKYIRSKSREKAISVIGGFSLAGIALGVATLIVVTSVMNGFRKEFTERIIGFNGHIALQPLNKSSDYQKTRLDLLHQKSVKQVVPMIEKHALISTERAVGGSLVCCIDANDLHEKKLISDNIVRGELTAFTGENCIVLGDALANKMHVAIGDPVVLVVPKMENTSLGKFPRKKTFHVVAMFKSGMHEYDSNVVYIPISMGQKLFRMKDSVSVLSIFTENPLQLNDLKCFLLRNYSSNFIITDWQSSNSSFMRAIEIERNVMFLILTLITLVASFNIISCMIMLVKDKERDIAILRTIGFTRSGIMQIFFMAGISIGVTGTIIGTILGLVFSINIQKIQIIIEKLFHTQVFSPEVYFLTNLPSVIVPNDVITTISVSLFLSCIATLHPARKASKLNPIEILRYA